ncbi:iron-sulfur cluster assembly protein [Promicromonospora kroppenstedtii]|uniref:Iron-sulfur cluster assembly protein n=1 Tax=Promicromonospora kroppenstedtii TaxID=440482 RepID=A0ABW7XGC6_9MICO
MSTLTRAPAPAPTEADVRRALDAVMDPELDQPVTDLGFVRSVALDGGRVEVHLRLPTSFCSPNFAYLMASDSKDALATLPGATHVVVELDDHHDSAIINAGLAADAGYRGTFRHEAEEGLDELRETFRRKAHTAAMERALTAVLRERPDLPETELAEIRLWDLPGDATTAALLRRRAAVGLSNAADALVLVDHDGVGHAPEQVPLVLRRARSTRISVDGNAHFCRGLLRTRYPGSEKDQSPMKEHTP